MNYDLSQKKNSTDKLLLVFLWDQHPCKLQIKQNKEPTWTNLTGEESLEADEIGCGLEGAENIGQEGERGEVGLGDIALKSKVYTFNYLACKL